MDASALIEPYAYVALVVGTFFEGEIALAAAGYAARQGHLDLGWVMAFGALGVFLSDWTCFLLGRFCSRALFARCPGLRQRIAPNVVQIQPFVVGGGEHQSSLEQVAGLVSQTD